MTSPSLTVLAVFARRTTLVSLPRRTGRATMATIATLAALVAVPRPAWAQPRPAGSPGSTSSPWAPPATGGTGTMGGPATAPQNGAAGTASATGATGANGSATQKRLDTAEKEDAGRGLEWAWIQLEGGGHYTALGGLGGDHLMVGDAKQTGGGALAGAAIGARLLFLTVGVRGRYAWAPDFRQWSIVPEVGLHIPLGNLEPHFFVGAGYTQLSGLDTSQIQAGPSLDVRGLDLRMGAGLRYYLSRHFSIGAMLTGDLTVMSRPGVFYAQSSPTTFGATGAPIIEPKRRDAAMVGTGTGIAVAGTAAIGVHF